MKRTPRQTPDRYPTRHQETARANAWWTALLVGLEALEFLERSRELAAEPVLATPLRNEVTAPVGQWSE